MSTDDYGPETRALQEAKRLCFHEGRPFDIADALDALQGFLYQRPAPRMTAGRLPDSPPMFSGPVQGMMHPSAIAPLDMVPAEIGITPPVGDDALPTREWLLGCIEAVRIAAVRLATQNPRAQLPGESAHNARVCDRLDNEVAADVDALYAALADARGESARPDDENVKRMP